MFLQVFGLCHRQMVAALAANSGNSVVLEAG
jgi:hypothetical protein